MKRKLLLGSLVSAGFLYLALRGIDWNAFAHAFGDVDYRFLVPTVAFTMLGHFSRAVRWRYMLTTIKPIAIGPLWSATAIAFMVNNLFPARLGEFVRAYAIGKTEGISKSAAFATIVYERIIDVFMLIALLWLCLFRVEGPDWMQRSGVILIVFNAALLGALYLMVRRPQAFGRLVSFVCRPLPGGVGERVRWWCDSFIDGLGVLKDRSALFPIVFFSFFVWGFATLSVYYTFGAMHMTLSPFASIVVIVLLSLGSMIPSAPAFVGTFQYACIVALAFYGIDKSHALAYSTVYHATQFFPITLAGLYYAWRSQMSLSEISNREGSR